MHRGLLTGGITLVVVGLLLLGGDYALQLEPTSAYVPAGQGLKLNPAVVGSVGVSLGWSGGTSGTTVYLILGSSAFSCPPSSSLTSGTGASGTLTATLHSGTLYTLFACTAGSVSAITVTYTSNGFTYIMAVGAALAVVGAVLLWLGRRHRVTRGPRTETTVPRPPA